MTWRRVSLEMSVWWIIACGLLRGKSLQQILEDKQDEYMRLIHENRQLEVKLEELNRKGKQDAS